MADTGAGGALRQRAHVLIDLGRYNDAHPIIEEALALDPLDDAAGCLLAWCLIGMGEPLKSLTSSRDVLSRRPNDNWALRLRAIACSRLPGLEDQALAAAREAVQGQPDAGANHRVLADVLLRRGDFDGARTEARLALNLEPLEPLNHEAAALIELKAGYLRRARRHLLSQLRLDPAAWTAHNNLGVVSQRRGNDVSAARHFRRSLRIMPDQTPIENLRSVLLRASIFMLNLVASLVAIAHAIAAEVSGPRWAVAVVVDGVICLLASTLNRRLPRVIRRVLQDVLPEALGGVGLPALLLAGRPQSTSAGGLRRILSRAAGSFVLVSALVAGFLPDTIGPGLAGTVITFCVPCVLLMIVTRALVQATSLRRRAFRR